MQEAAHAREQCAGDRLFPVGAVLVRDGHVVAKAGNGYNRGKGFVHVCPRVVLECPSGTGYELCQFHDAPGHAEPMLMQAAKEQGIDTKECDVYLYGHWWCCEPCWKVMSENRVRDVYLVENAYEEFQRDRVYAQTLKTHVRSVFVEDDLWSAPVLELGCSVVENADQADVEIRMQNKQLRFFKNGALIFEIAPQIDDQAERMIKNVLRQL